MVQLLQSSVYTQMFSNIFNILHVCCNTMYRHVFRMEEIPVIVTFWLVEIRLYQIFVIYWASGTSYLIFLKCLQVQIKGKMKDKNTGDSFDMVNKEHSQLDWRFQKLDTLNTFYDHQNNMLKYDHDRNNIHCFSQFPTMIVAIGIGTFFHMIGIFIT